MESRLIIACFEKTPDLKNPHHAFPLVRAWLKSDEIIVGSELSRDFPNRGCVYLPLDDDFVEQGSYGAFNCTESNPEHENRWRVDHVLDGFCEVIEPQFEVDTLNKLSGWLESASVLLHPIYKGNNEVFLFHRKIGLVGPLEYVNGRLREKGQVYKYTNSSIIINLPEGFKFILKNQLGSGTKVTLTKEGAAKALLRRLKEIDAISWLSRDKSSQLAECLAKFQEIDGLSWVKDDLKSVLERLDSLPDLKKEISDFLWSNQQIQRDLGEKWKVECTAAISRAKKELEKTNQQLSEQKKDLEILRGEVSNTQAEYDQLKRETIEARDRAKTAFQEELQVILSNPTHLLLLENLLRPKTKEATGIRFEKLVMRKNNTTDFYDGVSRLLKASGINKLNVKDIAHVVCAALTTGQPIFFQGLGLDDLVERLAISLGVDGWALDCPAGILDPVVWPTETDRSTKQSLLIRFINRSSIDIVLGTIRQRLVEQANGARTPTLYIIATLSPLNDFSVREMPFTGPIINENFLEISPVSPFSDDVTVTVPEKAIKSDECWDACCSFLKELKGIPAALSTGFFIQNLAHIYCYLESQDIEEDKIRTLIFKYWLLPRLEVLDRGRWQSYCSALIPKDSKIQEIYGDYEHYSE